MTTRQLIVVICAYLLELVAVIYFTRATTRRVAGAFVDGAEARASARAQFLDAACRPMCGRSLTVSDLPEDAL